MVVTESPAVCRAMAHFWRRCAAIATSPKESVEAEALAAEWSTKADPLHRSEAPCPRRK